LPGIINARVFHKLILPTTSGADND